MWTSGRTILFVIVLVIAGGIAMWLRSTITQPGPVAEAPKIVHIIVAKRDLTIGTFVQSAQDLDWADAPENQPQAENVTPEGETQPANTPSPIPKEDYLYEDKVRLTDFNGAVVRRTLHAGDPLTVTSLMKTGERGFMAAVLEPGKRAVSIAVTATSGNAGFVSPGDHVDLIVTQRIKVNGVGNLTEDKAVGDTFVQDVRVVAVDQMLDNPENKAILAKTVTVEVTQRQAEQVAVAAEIGKISIALRSLVTPETKDSEDKKTEAAKKAAAAKKDNHDAAHLLVDLYGDDNQDNSAQDNNPGLSPEHKNVAVPRVKVIHGDKSENIDFYQDRQ